jgi:hypothetical protein
MTIIQLNNSSPNAVKFKMTPNLMNNQADSTTSLMPLNIGAMINLTVAIIIIINNA